MNKAEELIACLEGEIAKRDEELALCRVAVENCELFRARIAELENECSALSAGACDGVVGDDYGHAYCRYKAELAAIKAQEPVAFAFRYDDGSWHDVSATQHSAGMVSLYAAPVSEAKAQGVVMPAELGRAFITGESCDGVYRVVIKSETLKEMHAVHHWITSLNAAPVQQVSVPDSWKLVPVNATEAILDVLYSNGMDESDSLLQDIWSAMLANAPSPAGVDGLEVVAYLIGGEPALKQCAVRGVVNEPLCRLSDAQAIIDGLRGDAERYRALRNSLSGQQHCSHTEMPCISDPISPFVTYTPDGLDAAIDAALSAGKEGE